METFRLMQLFDELWEAKIAPRLTKARKRNVKQTEDLLTKITRDALRSCPFRERLNLHADVKDNGKAAQLRKEGNKMFHPNVKRYIEALKLYNESITLSEKGSEERAFAYGNRSIICLEMQRYEECLENIRLARESNCPERLKEKLDGRENSAKQALAKMADKKASSSKDSSNAVNELQLSYPSHENAPQIANCLELHKNDQYGRHVVTNRKLMVGDIVMIDKPFVTVLDELFRYVRCDFCHAERIFTLLPCEGCSGVMYCSEECFSKAYKQYHRFECGVPRELWTYFDKNRMVYFRKLAKAIAIFDSDLVALKDHLDSLDETSVNAFTMDYRQATPKDIFNTVHVYTEQKSKDTYFRSSNIYIANIIQIVAFECTELGTIAESKPEISEMFFNLLVRYLPVLNQQLKAFEFDKDKGRYNAEDLAHGPFPLNCMLNHSCDPNVAPINLRDGRCAVLVIKPISEGDQLFTGYESIYFLTTSRKKRQKFLLEVYKFQCTCEACVNNYPTLFDMLGTVQTFYDDFCKLDLQYSSIFRNPDRKSISKSIARLQSELNDVTAYYATPLICKRQTFLMELYAMLYSHISENADYWKFCNP